MHKSLAILGLTCLLICHVKSVTAQELQQRHIYQNSAPNDFSHIKISRHQFPEAVASDAEIQQSLSNLIENYRQLLDWPEASLHINPHIILFSEQKAFDHYQIKRLGKKIARYGYYSPAHNEAVIYASDNISAKNIILHELAHAIHDTRGLSIPNWLNEGLAEYMTYHTLNPSYFDLKFNRSFKQHYWHTIQGAKQAPSLPELKPFLEKDYFKLEKNSAHNISDIYQIALTFTEFLMANYRQKLINSLSINHHKDYYTMNVLEFGTDQKTLQQHWQDWLSDSVGSSKQNPYR